MNLPKPLFTDGFLEDLHKREQKRRELVEMMEKLVKEIDTVTGIPDSFLESKKK
ncbi:MAG: hypothetical protein M0P12_03170 [Paludibacteraceae bacterium]|jgi:hypothetical protein|nr:hypothetical protein [Paludibacteraceae bacterium]MCK9616120.1 hypothetical protein [Candidatus Omnitrophota bacterium]